jgi:hypothetical protein
MYLPVAGGVQATASPEATRSVAKPLSASAATISPWLGFGRGFFLSREGEISKGERGSQHQGQLGRSLCS